MKIPKVASAGMCIFDAAKPRLGLTAPKVNADTSAMGRYCADTNSLSFCAKDWVSKPHRGLLWPSAKSPAAAADAADATRRGPGLLLC